LASASTVPLASGFHDVTSPVEALMAASRLRVTVVPSGRRISVNEPPM
jgi:hypothetical protein